MSGVALAFVGGSYGGGIPAIGAAYGGGFFAGQISTTGNSIANYNLVIGPIASAQSTLKWKTSNTSTSGTSSVIDGPSNSAAMNDASHPAAQFCEAVSAGSQTDWYMPAKGELEICYFNLKPSTTANNTSSGINANAVPARASNYTSGNPAQTAAASFVSGQAEAFALEFYWSSTEASSPNGWSQYLLNGNQYSTVKSNVFKVRAVRRIAV